MRRLLGLFVLVLAVAGITAWRLPPSSAASTINVPADYPTIQAAINAAVDGDVVLVAPGTYTENVNYVGKDIEVRSVGGSGITSIDGGAAGTVVTFASGETSAAVLRGFTITNGSSLADGGGIRVSMSSPSILDNEVRSNVARLGGGGISIEIGSPTIQGNLIADNHQASGASGGPGGGGILIRGGSPLISQNALQRNRWVSGGGVVVFHSGVPTSPIFIGNTFIDNTTTAAGNNGGAVFNGAASTIVNNLFIDNGAGSGSAIFSIIEDGLPSATITNNTFYLNHGDGFTQGATVYLRDSSGGTQMWNNIVVANGVEDSIFCYTSAPQVVRFNNASGGAANYSGTCAGLEGEEGNISQDPDFVDPSNLDFHLSLGSPSIDTGSNDAPGLPATDFEGLPRISDGNNDGFTFVDQGIYELQGTAPTIVKIPDGNEANANPMQATANLWLCSSGPCIGPGEGALRVVEHATNVADGLGAYEFSVEYDNFVIQSVNPCDLVFGPGGAGSARGPVDELDASAVNADCAPDPGALNNGTCALGIVLENLVHFGCVTMGQSPGPTGDFDLASLLLVPHPDLNNDLFPGNNNGVVTVIKDNGCELVDIFGHAVSGSINGGLTPVCGNLAITVRILEGDLDLDCDVDITDAQLIASKYGAFFGGLLYSKWFDLEPQFHDLDLDIKDVQKVFGRDGSTCQDPIPAQPPLPPFTPFGD